MAKIAVLVGDMFEDVEYVEPVKAYNEAGHKIVNVGLQEGSIVRGKREGVEVRIDVEARTSSPNDFDALFIPGGYSPDNLRAHSEVVDFVAAFVESDKPVFAICHAPQLLISAQVMKGRRVTGWKSVKQDIINAGAEYLDREVVVDGNLISSRKPGDIPAFIEETLKALT